MRRCCAKESQCPPGSTKYGINRSVNSCNDLLGHYLEILTQTEHCTAKNAFHDLDVLFSVGFVFILVEAINPDKNLGLYGVEESKRILQYLITVGNQAALKRYTELHQMSIHLQHSAHGLSDERASRTSIYDPGRGAISGQATGSEPSNTSFSQADPPTASQQGLLSGDVVAESDAGMIRPRDNIFASTGTLADISLDGESELYEIYHAPGFTYTGAEMADWESLDY